MQADLLTRLGEDTGGKYAFLKLKSVNLALSKTVQAETTCSVTYLYPEQVENFDETAREEVAYFTRKILALSFPVAVKFVKSHIDAEYLKRDIYTFFRSSPAVAALIGENDIAIAIEPEAVTVSLSFVKPLYDHVTGQGLTARLEAFLADNYCMVPRVKLALREENAAETEALGEIGREREHVVREREMHTMDVREVSPFIGALIEERPRRIRDVSIPLPDAVLCGRIEDRKCFDIKNGKNPEGRHVFNFTIHDGTGSIKTLFFSKPDNDQRAQTLKEGDKIIVRGNIDRDEFNGRSSLVMKARAIGLCEIMPVDTTVVKAPPPAKYSTVFPKKVVDFRQDDLFAAMAGGPETPPYFRGKSFVVFDVETTGLLSSDKIIELSAYKMTDGVICEEFSTLVNPQAPLHPDIVKLTNITDADLVGAPLIDEVIGDFYKFCEGCVLVAHNIQFDHGFISRAGEKFDYVFDNEQLDTIKLAQQNLRGLTRFSLSAVCNHLGIVNDQAHRAASDAYATAQVLLRIPPKTA